MKAAVARQLDRRGFIKSAGAGAAAAATLGFTSDADLEAAVQNVNPRSIPSELKITDMRVATVVGAPMTCPSGPARFCSWSTASRIRATSVP